MSQYKVLVTDYAWPDLEIERQILARHGAELLVAERNDPAELLELAPQADAILTCWRDIPEAVLDAAPRCLIVSRYGIGLDNIPVDRASALGIVVTNVPDYCQEEVADHTMALLLSAARQIVPLARATRSGKWSLAAVGALPRLRGQTLGLVGYGNIARAVADRARGFGFKIIAYTPRLPIAALADQGVATNDLNYLLEHSDYVSLHVPLDAGTRNLIGADALRHMKPSAFLINTSRGAVIDEDALCRALRTGEIAGAALDVLCEEPPQPDNPLLHMENVIVTPHAAFYSGPAIRELQTRAAEHVVAALRGQTPVNIVNPEVLDHPEYRLRSS